MQYRTIIITENGKLFRHCTVKTDQYFVFQESHSWNYHNTKAYCHCYVVVLNSKLLFSCQHCDVLCVNVLCFGVLQEVTQVCYSGWNSCLIPVLSPTLPCPLSLVPTLPCPPSLVSTLPCPPSYIPLFLPLCPFTLPLVLPIFPHPAPSLPPLAPYLYIFSPPSAPSTLHPSLWSSPSPISHPPLSTLPILFFIVKDREGRKRICRRGIFGQLKLLINCDFKCV